MSSLPLILIFNPIYLVKWLGFKSDVLEQFSILINNKNIKNMTKASFVILSELFNPMLKLFDFHQISIRVKLHMFVNKIRFIKYFMCKTLQNSVISSVKCRSTRCLSLAPYRYLYIKISKQPVFCFILFYFILFLFQHTTTISRMQNVYTHTNKVNNTCGCMS